VLVEQLEEAQMFSLNLLSFLEGNEHYIYWMVQFSNTDIIPVYVAEKNLLFRLEL